MTRHPHHPPRRRPRPHPGPDRRRRGHHLAAQPLFCDLLTHVPLSLEGEVGIERARRFKTNSFTAYDTIVDALTTAGTMTTAQMQDLITAALGLTANLWQLSHPTPTLAELYAQHPAGVTSHSTSNHA